MSKNPERGTNIMGEAYNTLRAGDWVEVKTPFEIVETLDSNGVLDGLPFMPEMLEWCGRRFRVIRKAEKTCLEPVRGNFIIREFLQNDVYLLDGVRCSGADHDGCQRLCMFFWKSAWLRKVENDQVTKQPDSADAKMLRRNLKTMSAPGHYFCQTTELVRATRLEPLTKIQILAKCIREVKSGAVGVIEMLGLICVPLYRKIRDAMIGRPILRGNLTQTPVGELSLQKGDLVEIKPLHQLKATLDHKGRNRGLRCDIELEQFCGNRYRVRSLLDRMISEPTGEMRRLEATVFLEGSLCGCGRVLGGCPRMEFNYWREVWLNRVDSLSSGHLGSRATEPTSEESKPVHTA